MNTLSKDSYNQLLKYIDSLDLSSDELYMFVADIHDLANIQLEIEEKEICEDEETPSQEVERENMEAVLLSNRE